MLIIKIVNILYGFLLSLIDITFISIGTISIPNIIIIKPKLMFIIAINMENIMFKISENKTLL